MSQSRINAFRCELTHSKTENICNAEFCNRDNLKRHQKKIHKVSSTTFVRCTFSFNVSTTLSTRTTILSNAQTTSTHFSIISSLQQSIVKSHDSTTFFHVSSKSANNSERNDETQSQMTAAIDIDEHFWNSYATLSAQSSTSFLNILNANLQIVSQISSFNKQRVSFSMFDSDVDRFSSNWLSEEFWSLSLLNQVSLALNLNAFDDDLNSFNLLFSNFLNQNASLLKSLFSELQSSDLTFLKLSFSKLFLFELSLFELSLLKLFALQLSSLKFSLSKLSNSDHSASEIWSFNFSLLNLSIAKILLSNLKIELDINSTSSSSLDFAEVQDSEDSDCLIVNIDSESEQCLSSSHSLTKLSNFDNITIDNKKKRKRHLNHDDTSKCNARIQKRLLFDYLRIWRSRTSRKRFCFNEWLE